jgi:hypothetical protein
MIDLEELMGDHKYMLVMAGEQKDGFFHVTLNLTGEETTDQAVSRFKDALVVLRHTAMEKYGRSVVEASRIDGRPGDDVKHLTGIVVRR